MRNHVWDSGIQSKISVKHFVTHEGFYETNEETPMNDFQDSFWYPDIQLIHKSSKPGA